MKKFFDKPFYYNASPEIIHRAKNLRANMTPAEMALWEKLKGKQLNSLHFRRQHPIMRFIVDFYCHEKLLVIELDGEIHNNYAVAERDNGREDELQQLGLRVIRFTNSEVLSNINNVLLKIEKEVR